MEILSEIAPREIFPGLIFRLVHGAASTLSFVTIKEGSQLGLHSHPHEQISYIMEGELEMTIGDEKMLLTKGAVHVIPGNVPHSAVALTEVKILDFFAPARDDYR
ncbi:MAG: cupin domain-containing protein [Chitinophagaceae bacterium]|nr:MAG: cupin domain-containing protein [Chitinophagaceae bacterium]